MSSSTDPGYSRWTFAAGLCMALSLAACPGDDTSVTSTSGSSSDGPGSTSATTAPNDSTGPADTGPSSATDSTTNNGSSGTAGGSDTAGTTGAESSGTTGGAESGTTEGAESGTTEGAESSGTTGGAESSGTTAGFESSGTTGDTFGMETGVVFIVEPDVGAGDECDLWLQDCLPGDKCMPYAAGGGGAWDAAGCFPIDPAPVAVGDVCEVVGGGTSGVDNCEAGAMCWDVDAVTNEGTCVAMCTGSPMAPVCADPGTNCAIANDGYIILCLPGCDPLAQDCAGTDGCYAVGDSFLCAPDASGAFGADGDSCEFINGCDPGNMCLDPGATGDCLGAVGCCTPFCNITVVPDPCPHPAETCEAFYEPGMAPPGYEEVGVCSVAP